MKKILLWGFLFIFVSAPLFADDLTHALGTARYMIREARLVEADKKDPENYFLAVQYHKKARLALRGSHEYGENHKIKRNLEQAILFARLAYQHAKMARDHSQKWPYETSKDFFDRSLKK